MSVWVVQHFRLHGLLLQSSTFRISLVGLTANKSELKQCRRAHSVMTPLKPQPKSWIYCYSASWSIAIIIILQKGNIFVSFRCSFLYLNYKKVPDLHMDCCHAPIMSCHRLESYHIPHHFNSKQFFYRNLSLLTHIYSTEQYEYMHCVWVLVL